MMATDDASIIDARRAAGGAARSSYGRLLAYVAARTRNIPAAEEALADAFRIALETWPSRGVPDNPEAWLLTVARRNAIHQDRRRTVADAALPTLCLIQEESTEMENPLFPDERLKLMFICAHPAIDEAARTPLMLQTVLGFDAATIASAFLVPPATMGQRLVRAKAKIRDARIAFEVPDKSDLEPRLEAVLSAIYAAFGSGWEVADRSSGRSDGLDEEAIWLARVLVSLLPDEPEALGLLALMLYADARRPARRGSKGEFVPLDRQDTRLWSRAAIVEAENLLRRAAKAGRIGRFQIEAAIQSVHCQRAITGRTNWPVLTSLYEVLAIHAPAAGVFISRAAVRAETNGPSEGLALLEELPDAITRDHQPWWAVRADLLGRVGRRTESLDAYRVALGLTTDPAVRAFLIRKANSAGEKIPGDLSK